MLTPLGSQGRDKSCCCLKISWCSCCSNAFSLTSLLGQYLRISGANSVLQRSSGWRRVPPLSDKTRMPQPLGAYIYRVAAASPLRAYIYRAGRAAAASQISEQDSGPKDNPESDPDIFENDIKPIPAHSGREDFNNYIRKLLRLCVCSSTRCPWATT